MNISLESDNAFRHNNIWISFFVVVFAVGPNIVDIFAHSLSIRYISHKWDFCPFHSLSDDQRDSMIRSFDASCNVFSQFGITILECEYHTYHTWCTAYSSWAEALQSLGRFLVRSQLYTSVYCYNANQCNILDDFYGTIQCLVDTVYFVQLYFGVTGLVEIWSHLGGRSVGRLIVCSLIC